MNVRAARFFSGTWGFLIGSATVIMSAIPFVLGKKELAIIMLCIGLLILIYGCIDLKRSLTMDESDGDLTEPEKY